MTQQAQPQGPVDVNLFRGGPHHNELITTREITRDHRYGWVAAYRWTPEVVIGSESGRKARVWKYHSD